MDAEFYLKTRQNPPDRKSVFRRMVDTAERILPPNDHETLQNFFRLPLRPHFYRSRSARDSISESRPVRKLFVFAEPIPEPERLQRPCPCRQTGSGLSSCCPASWPWKDCLRWLRWSLGRRVCSVMVICFHILH